MAVLRLFAAAREAAGTATDEVPGRTVDEVLAAARARYGETFARVAASSQVWRNGTPASGGEPVGPGDEVAVLPPVSGGSGLDDGDRPRLRPRPVSGPGAPDDPVPAARRRRSSPPAGDELPPAPWERSAPAPAVPERRPPADTAVPRRRTAAPTDERPRPHPQGRRDGVPPGAPPSPPPPGEHRPAPAPPRARARRAATPARAPGVTGAPRPAATTETKAPARAGRLTRLRSVAVPVTGEVRVWGKERPVSGPRLRRTEFGRRYAITYDTTGWKVSLGLVWFVVALGAMIQGWAALSLLYGVAAGWAALELARRHREVGGPAHLWASALGGAAVAAAGGGGVGLMGAAILATVAGAVAAAAIGGGGRAAVLSAAAATVWCAVPVGLAAASVVLTRDLEIGAAVVLLVFVSCYEAGDFLIGSGASNSVEGPLVGILTIGVAAMVVAVLQVPPFDGEPVFTFAALAAVACPLGQLVGSALLPAADARAPALRRLDSLLLLAPAWCLTVGLYMDSVA